MAAPRFILGLFTFLSFRLFCVTLCFPFSELPLAFLGFVICNDIGKNAPGDCFNSVWRNTGIVHGFLFATHKFLIPPGSIKFSRYSWIYAYGRGFMADLLSDVGLFDTGTGYAVLPGKNLRNENADTCQAIAFLCLHIFIFCVPILYQKQPIPSRELRGKNIGIRKRETVTVVKEKAVVLQQFFLQN